MRARHARLAYLLLLTACGKGSSTVGPSGTPASVELSGTSVTFTSLTETQDLTATVRDAASVVLSNTVSWSSTAGGVATVNNNGRVTAVGNGSAQIIATAGTVADTANVTVQQVAATLTLTPDTLRLAAPGDTATIGRTVRDALGSVMTGVPATFATSDPAIATVVVATGRVTAQGNGSTTVIGQVAPGGSGLTKSVRIEVGGVLPAAYLMGGFIGASYTDQIDPVSGAGGTFTYTVTAGALPTGLSLNSSSRQITGIPTTAGAFFFEVSASNGALTRSERFAITISTKPASGFNLWVAYNGGAMPPANARTALNAALARFEEVVTGDMGAPITYPPSGLSSGTCQLVNASLMNGAFIEDVSILMAVDSVDGTGPTLARGGFCGYGRPTAPPSTITGQMRLDEVEAATASATYLQDVIWHEIAHVLGVGTFWQSQLQFLTTDSVRYYGTSGNTEWRALGGPADGVPVEIGVEAHWREGFFEAEIMTPTTEGPGVRLPISRMTIGTLIDLGWPATLSAADAYSLPGCSPGCTIPARLGAPSADEGAFHDDVVNGPLLPLPPGSVGRR